MIRSVAITILLLLFCSYQSDSFKEEQLRYSRVRQAYKDKEEPMLILLQEKGIAKNKLQLYLRVFKREKEMELWGKEESEASFTLIKAYDICRTSGEPGPKRKQGDLQIPEGFYHINIFNPYSNFYLSLGINYPNKSDRILGEKGNLGGEIFIHGDCVTIGCVPITDEQIKELYIFCIEARNNGQTTIPVTVFPSKLSEAEFERLYEKYPGDSDKIGLWADLKKGFDIFNDTKQFLSIGFLDSGRHDVKNILVE